MKILAMENLPSKAPVTSQTHADECVVVATEEKSVRRNYNFIPTKTASACVGFGLLWKAFDVNSKG